MGGSRVLDTFSVEKLNLPLNSSRNVDLFNLGVPNTVLVPPTAMIMI